MSEQRSSTVEHYCTNPLVPHSNSFLHSLPWFLIPFSCLVQWYNGSSLILPNRKECNKNIRTFSSLARFVSLWSTSTQHSLVLWYNPFIVSINYNHWSEWKHKFIPSNKSLSKYCSEKKVVNLEYINFITPVTIKFDWQQLMYHSSLEPLIFCC